MKSGAFSSEWLTRRLAALLPEYPHVALCIALSGGVDSVALAAALATRRRKGASKRAALRAVHVHHGLHANADKWSRHCTRIAAQLGIPLTVLRVDVARTRGASIEAAARDARYEALAAALSPGEVLLTAHHADDQLETVLLQLMRGAGIPGLAAMPAVARFAQGWLARPLLSRSRTELEQWAVSQKLSWIDDDTNLDERFDRNYLRRRVLPTVRERWPGVARAVARTARHAAEARRLLDAIALADVERAAAGAALSVQRLRALDADRRRNAIRFWIARSGHEVPDTRRLDEIAGPMLAARADANPRVQWEGVVVQRQTDLLTMCHGDGAPPFAPIQWEWRARRAVTLPGGAGELVLEPDALGPIALDALPRRLTIRPREGGERLRPNARGRSRTLKALLQEGRVPVADRARIPLILHADKLLAVADLWADASIQATRGTRLRARLRWRRPAQVP